MNDLYYIYEIKNNINGKTYVGQHKYKKLNDKYMGSGIALKNAYKKYGKENFTKTILESGIETQEKANEREIYWIAEYWKLGKAEYNISKGGGKIPYLSELSLEKQIETRKKMSNSHIGLKHTQEEISKIRNCNLGKIVSEETRKKLSESHKGNKIWLGKHHSEETKRKISEAHKGKKLTGEHREKDRLSQIGRKHTEETKKKISENNKGKHQLSVEHKEKLRQFNLGKHLSDETRKKISEGNKGKIISEETRKKLSESAKNRPKVSDETRKKMSESAKKRPITKGSKGMSWFNNGIVNKMGYECPDGFVKGRIKEIKN